MIKNINLEYHLAIKRNKTVPSAEMQRDLESHTVKAEMDKKSYINTHRQDLENGTGVSAKQEETHRCREKMYEHQVGRDGVG